MDKRIGKTGGNRPAFTLLGLPVFGQVTKTRSLGDGYYCIVDFGTIPNEQELIDELKGEIPVNESKRKRKTTETDSPEDNVV